MVYYPKHVVEDTIKDPSPAAHEKRPLGDARHLEPLGQPEDSNKASVEVDSSLKQKLNSDLRQALRGKDKLRSSVIRLVMSAIHNSEIAKQTSLEDIDILGVISKEAKQRKESIEAFKQGNRQDLVAQEEAELAILDEYLPEQMCRDEIMIAARNVINEVSAESLKDKGRVMSKLIPSLKGKADGRVINEIVTKLLS